MATSSSHRLVNTVLVNTMRQLVTSATAAGTGAPCEDAQPQPCYQALAKSMYNTHTYACEHTCACYSPL